MSISLIVMLGLPVLYLTGSLRKSTSVAGVSGVPFVLYFIISIVLSVFPSVPIFDGVSVSLAGAFICIAPIFYIGLRKHFTFRFYLASVLTVLISVTASFVSISYTVTFLSAALTFFGSLISLIFMKNRAALYAPVLIGIYSVVGDIMLLLTEAARMVTVFNVMDVANMSIVACLTVSYLFSRPWHRAPAVQT